MPEQTVKHQHFAAFLSKGDQISAFFFVVNEHYNAIIKFDRRNNPHFSFFSYLTEADAKRCWTECLTISRDRGWTVSFQGKPNNAALS